MIVLCEKHSELFEVFVLLRRRRNENNVSSACVAVAFQLCAMFMECSGKFWLLEKLDLMCSPLISGGWLVEILLL